MRTKRNVTSSAQQETGKEKHLNASVRRPNASSKLKENALTYKTVRLFVNYHMYPQVSLRFNLSNKTLLAFRSNLNFG